MWVVYCTHRGSTYFADDGWDDTSSLTSAARFASQSDAAGCAAGLNLSTSRSWHVVQFKAATRW